MPRGTEKIGGRAQGVYPSIDWVGTKNVQKIYYRFSSRFENEKEQNSFLRFFLSHTWELNLC